MAARACDVEIQVRGLRDMNGTIHLCLSRSADHFPDCSGDPAALSRTVPAAEAGRIVLRDVPPGIYAIAAIHDENGNGRLDKFLGIPREGFGFSRDPRLRMGPPRFDEARFTVGGARVVQAFSMKYLF
jgi:uncharacterized protein (DUF2141 family)